MTENLKSDVKKDQLILIAMMDGFGLDYYRNTELPFIHGAAANGFFTEVKSVFPSVTNANNCSIATGAWPSQHGISANSLYDREKKAAVYHNASTAIRVPTIFERACSQGVVSALLTSKRKTKELFSGRANIVIAAEALTLEEESLFGSAPPIYSAEINHWLWDTALKLIREKPEIGLLYVHTTDYPMHAWAPEREESIAHLRGIDQRIQAFFNANPQTALFMTADHGMNAKNLNWDLERACAEAGTPIEFALSPERDYYPGHHKNYTGCAWVWLKNQSDREPVRQVIGALEGVESVLDSDELAERYNLDPSHLGDLVVLGDVSTMFGPAESTREDLPPGYRAHGSLHEMDLPLIIYNYGGKLPAPEAFQHNKDLASFLYSQPSAKGGE